MTDAPKKDQYDAVDNDVFQSKEDVEDFRKELRKAKMRKLRAKKKKK